MSDETYGSIAEAARLEDSYSDIAKDALKQGGQSSSYDRIADATEADLAKGRVASAANTYARGLSEGMADVVKGAVRAMNPNTALWGAGFGAMPSPDMIENAQKWNATPGAEKEKQITNTPPYAAAERFAQAGRENYRPNPLYEGEWLAQRIPGAVASTTVPLAAGLVAGPGVAGVTYGLQGGQQGAQEAVDAGNPDAADKAFLGYALAGGASEATLGVGANIWRYVRAARKAGVKPEGFRGWMTIAARGAGREAAQEGIEQVGQNIVFDRSVAPRPWLQGVPEAMALGGIVGGGFAGAAAAAGMRGRQQPGTQLEEHQDELPTPTAPVLETPVAEQQAQLQQINQQLAAAAERDAAIDYSPMDTAGGDSYEAIADREAEISNVGGDTHGQEVQGQETVTPQATASPAVPAGTGTAQGEVGLDLEQGQITDAGKIGLVRGTKAERWADDVLNGSRANLRVGMDPVELAAYAVKGAALIEDGISNFRQWSGVMLREYGTSIEPYLQAIHQRASGRIEQNLDRWVGKPLDSLSDTLPADPESPSLMDTSGSRAAIVQAARAVYESWPAKIRAFDGSEITLRNPEKGSHGKRLRHLTTSESREGMHTDKAAWMPAVPETLSGGSVRLSDAETGNQVYVRKYGDGTSHYVVVSPDGVVIDQKPFKGGLITQFAAKSPGRRGQMRITATRRSGGAGVSQETTRPDPAGSIAIPGSGQPAQQRQPGRADLQRSPEQPGEPQSQTTSPEDAVNQAINRLKIKGGGLMEGVTGLPVWLWNGSLDAVKLAYQATKSLSKAIAAGLDWIRQHAPAVQFSEAEYRQAVEGALGIREHGQKVLASDDVAAEIKGEVSNLLYQRRTNEADADFAARIIRQVGGPEAAVAVFTDDANGLPSPVRSMLGMEITKALSAQSLQAQAAGNGTEAERLNAVAARFLDESFLPHTTSLAQGLQALNAWFALTPAGKLVWARLNLQRAASKLVDRIRPEVTQGIRDLQAAQLQASEAAAKQSQVQAAARAAIDAAVDRDARTPGSRVQQILAREASARAAVARAPAEMAEGFWTDLAKRDEYWAAIVRGSSMELERAVRALLSPKAKADNNTVADFANRLVTVLRQQLNQGLQQSGATARSKPNYLAALRELLTNAERMAQIWGVVREQMLAQYPGNAAVEAMMARPFDVWSKPLLKGVLKQWLAEQGTSLRELVRGHYLLPQGQLSQRLVQQLGLDEATAKRLSAAFDRVYADEMAKAAGRVKAAAGRVRRDPALIRLARAGVVTVDSMPDSELALAVADAISRRRMAMGKLIRQHGSQLDVQGVDLATQLIAEAGLTGEEAAKFADLVRKEVNRLAAEKRRAVLERMLRPARAIGIIRPGSMEKLLAAINLGALSEERFWNALKERLDLPTWTPELAADLATMADEIHRIPEDQMERRQRAAQRFQNALERARGVSLVEIGLATYLTNILTGFTTHLANSLSTGLNATGAIGAEIERAIVRGQPGDIVLIMEALGHALRPAGRAAWDVLRTGVVTGTRLKKVEPGRIFELAEFGRPGGVPVAGQGLGARVTRAALESRLARILNLWKLNYRAMAAEDMVFFKPLEEVKAAMLALQMARNAKLKGPEAQAEARRILGYGAQQVAHADAQAAAEGFTGSAAKRRAAEILQLNRGTALVETAAEYARRNTFNSDPYGLLGHLAHALNRLKGSEDARMRVAANIVVPFTNIVSNVVNEGLNWGPIGFARGRAALTSANPLGVPAATLTPAQRADMRAELLAKATIGTALLAALGLKAAMHLDDDDPEFAIYGFGPRNPSDRQGLEAMGWKPHTIKIGGRYYSYAYTPLSLYMATLGNWLDLNRDARKFGNRDAQRVLESAPEAVAASIAQGIKVIADQSFVSGLMELAETVSNPQQGASSKGFLKIAARTAAAILVPNLIGQVDRQMDPVRRENRDAEAILVGAIPFVRRLNQPSLDALGRPISSTPLDRFGTAQKGDEIVRALAQRGLWPEIPDRNHVWTRKGRAMDEAEFYAYHRDSGQLIQQRLAYFRPSWDIPDRERAAKRVASIVSDARAQVRRRMGF